MPIYVYVCPRCEVRWEERRMLRWAALPAECPLCKLPVERGVAGFAFLRGAPSGARRAAAADARGRRTASCACHGGRRTAARSR